MPEVPAGIDAEFVGTDLSHAMLSRAKENTTQKDISLTHSDALKLPIATGERFDLVHVAYLLHHLKGSTRGKSFDIIRETILSLVERLSSGGALVIEEIFFNSYAFSSLTSAIIFYSLKLLNFLHVDASRVSRGIQLGLEVNLLTEEQVYLLAAEFGYTHRLLDNTSSKPSRLMKLLFVKEHGHLSVTLRK